MVESKAFEQTRKSIYNLFAQKDTVTPEFFDFELGNILWQYEKNRAVEEDVEPYPNPNEISELR